MNERISQIVHRELGRSAQIIGRIDEGLAHETYKIRFEGEDYILQVVEGQPEHEESLSRGLNCYLASQNTEIPVPAVVTETVREFDGNKYTLVEKLPGNTGYLDISPKRVQNAGLSLAKIHETWPFENAGKLRFDDQQVSVEAFLEGSEMEWRHRKVLDNAEYLQANGLKDAGRAVARLFNQAKWESQNASEAALCHNDFTPDNVLFQGDEVTGIIDFDNAYAGSTHRDIAKAANGFWMHDPCVDWDVRSAFYDGYRERKDLNAAFERNEPMNRVETLAVTIGGMARLGELSNYEKACYSERILDAIERVKKS